MRVTHHYAAHCPATSAPGARSTGDTSRDCPAHPPSRPSCEGSARFSGVELPLMEASRSRPPMILDAPPSSPSGLSVIARVQCPSFLPMPTDSRSQEEAPLLSHPLAGPGTQDDKPGRGGVSPGPERRRPRTRACRPRMRPGRGWPSRRGRGRGSGIAGSPPAEAPLHLRRSRLMWHLLGHSAAPGALTASPMGPASQSTRAS